MGARFGVEPFSTIRGVVHLTDEYYGFTPMSKALPWPSLVFEELCSVEKIGKPGKQT